jgi:hypothetical protein
MRKRGGVGMTRAENLTRTLERSGPYDLDAITRKDARARADAFYREHGRKSAPVTLLSQTGKLEHSEGFAVGLQLRPGAASGVEVCSWRTAGCTAACVLETSFRGKSDGVRDGRSMRTLFLQTDPQAMVSLVAHELRALVRKHGRVAFRPNIASDLRWEYIAPDLFSIPGVAGYDYTKANPLKHRGTLANYRLTYSVSEHPLSEAIGHAYVKAGGTAAVVIATPKHAVPDTWKGLPAIDGDLTDDRTSDPAGCYVLLAAKADGKRDATGFVKLLPLAVAS